MASDQTLPPWLEFVFQREGSTRPAALIRIALPLLLWAGWGSDLILFRSMTAVTWLLVFSFWLSTSLMLVGYKSQIASAAAGATSLAIIYVLGSLDGRSDAFAHHHTSLLAFATTIAALTPCGRSYSVDRWLAIKRAEERGDPVPEERANLWGMRLLALQLSAVYFWGAVDKTNAAFLSGQRMEAIVIQYYFDAEPQRAWAFHPVVVASSVATTLLEYVLAFGLWVARLRRWLIPIGIAFHAAIYLTLPVQSFSFVACLLYLAFVSPDAVHAVIDRLSGRR